MKRDERYVTNYTCNDHELVSAVVMAMMTIMPSVINSILMMRMSSSTYITKSERRTDVITMFVVLAVSFFLMDRDI